VQRLGWIDQTVERRATLLLVDLDRNARELFAEIVRGLDCEIRYANDQDSARAVLGQEEIGVVLLDARTIPNHLELVREIKQNSARVEVLVADTRGTIPTAVATIKAGASNYLEKPLDQVVLADALSQALKAYSSFHASVRPLEELERRAIEHALAQANGDKIEAARLLAIGKTTLYRKLREYGGRSGPSREKATSEELVG
jgi:DNA-binding NtrC family response regulator